MSAQPVVTGEPRRAPSPPAAPRTRGRLRLVAPPRPRLARTPFLVLLIGLVGVGMVGLLLLNTGLQSQAFKASELRRQAAETAYAEGELEQLVIEAGSTRELTRKATELGMRPNREVAFVRLPDGLVSGEPGPSDGLFLPSALSKSPEQLAKERAEKARERAAERRAQEQKVMDGHRQRILDARAQELAAAEQAARDAAERAGATGENPTAGTAGAPAQRAAAGTTTTERSASQPTTGTGSR